MYFNGIPAPLVMVSPEKVNAQIPWELADTTSINAYVRSVQPDGSVMVTTPVAVTIVPANPGIFAQPNTAPSAGLVYHGSSSATGVVSVDGTATANDFESIQQRVRKEVDAATDEAERSPLPRPEEAALGLFAGDRYWT